MPITGGLVAASPLALAVISLPSHAESADERCRPEGYQET